MVNPQLLEGYPTFAEFMAKDQDAAIYRRFQSLSARSLLYQESELHDLERRSQEIDHEEAKNCEALASFWGASIMQRR